MTVNERPVGGTAPSLERDAIGLPEVLFQSITHMAPAVATALSIGAATSFAGGITPLAVLFAMIAVLFTAFAMAELAKHLPSAGGLFTYVDNGLGSFFGWLVAWGYALAEPLVMPLLLGGFGFYGAIFLSTYLHINFEYAWIGLAVLCGLVVWFLIYRGIGLSTRTGVVLGIIEIAIFLLVSIAAHRERPAEHAERVPARRRRRPTGLPGDDLLPARLHRLRGGGAAGRGDQGATAHDPTGRHLVGRPDRPVLRLQLLRGDGLLRARQDDRVLHVQRRRPVGLHGRAGAARDRRPADHLRDPQQLARERQLGRHGGDPDAVRDGPRAGCSRTGSPPSIPARAPRSTRSTSRRSPRSSSRSSWASSCPTTRTRRPRAPGASAASTCTSSWARCWG